MQSLQAHFTNALPSEGQGESKRWNQIHRRLADKPGDEGSGWSRLVSMRRGDLLLHPFGVGVLDAVGKIIAFTHGDHLHIVVVQKELLCAQK